MSSQRRMLVPALVGLVLLLAAAIIYLLADRSRPADPQAILVKLPTAAPPPAPTPLPTRPPEVARLQDAAANQALDQLRQVTEGKDPHSLPGSLATDLTIAACPFGCARTPRLAGFELDSEPVWAPVGGRLISTWNPLQATLRARISGTRRVDLGDGKPPRAEPFTTSVTVGLSREFSPKWEPLTMQFEPPIVPQQTGTVPQQPSVPAGTAVPSSGLEMPATTPGPETVAEQRERADEVLMAISTLGAGEPLPYQLRPQVVEQIKGIISRFAPPGRKVTGFSFQPVAWERVEVREQDSLALVGPEETAAMVGYLEGSVWLADKSGKRVPKPLDPLSDHLVINLELEKGRWVVTNVSDGKVDTHTPRSEGRP